MQIHNYLNRLLAILMGTCPYTTIYGDYMPYLWGHPKKSTYGNFLSEPLYYNYLNTILN